MSIRNRKGFTIIEVTLFLAITAALLAGILAGSVSSIKRHRYNDSVNDFVEFLRRTYSEVVNVENERINSIGDKESCSIIGMVTSANKLVGLSDGSWYKWTKANEVKDYHAGRWEERYNGYPGRSQCAIYGMLITFGEDDDKTIYTYDVIGQTLEKHKDFNANTEYDTINDALKDVKADILTLRVEGDQGGNPTCQIVPAGNTEKYKLQWDAYAENIDGGLFKGSVLIVRSPVSGTIHTLFIDKPIEANAVIENRGNSYNVSNSSGYCNPNALDGYIRTVEENRLLAPYIDKEKEDTIDQFKASQIDICVASDDSIDMDNQRRNVRILRDGRNATAVELVPQDLPESEGGNKCTR